MSHSRKDRRIQVAARLATTLLSTPDEGLERFRERRAGDLRVQPDDLKLARDVLDAVGFALAGTDRANWQRLRQAWEVVRRNTPPEVVDATEPSLGAQPTTPRPGSAPKPAAMEQGPMATPISVPAPVVAAPPPAIAAPPTVGASPWSSHAAPRQAEVDNVDATQGIDVVLIARDILPFSGEADAPMVSTVEEPHPEVGATSFALPVLSSDALPFDSGPPTELASREHAPDLDGTREVDALLLEEDALPFGSSESSVRAAPSRAGEEEHPEAGATSYMMPTISVDDELPFTKPPAPGELSLQQYASFLVELERTSDRRGLQHRYGIADDATARRLVSAWRERLAADPSLAAELARLTADYRAWLDKGSS